MERNPHLLGVTWDAQPEKTHVVVVGIATYQIDPGWRLALAAKQAVEFAEWAHAAGVPSANLHLFLSEPDHGYYADRIRGLGIEPKVATHAIISGFIDKELTRLSGELLYFYWSGHGSLIHGDDRILYYEDLSRTSQRHLDLTYLLVRLKHEPHGNFPRQIVYADACAAPVQLMNFQYSPGYERPGIGDRVDKVAQVALLSAQLGVQSGEGVFSGVLLGALKNQLTADPTTWPADPDAVADIAIRELIRLKQKPVRLRQIYRSGDADTIPIGEDLQDLPQAALVAELTSFFAGRRNEQEQIKTALADPDGPRYILIDAPIGYGKSALAAKLVSETPGFLYYFIREDGDNTSKSVLESLCTQLSKRTGRAQKTGQPPEDAFPDLLAAAAGSGKALVIVIDGLDESDHQDTILKPKYFAAPWPNVRYVLTYRTGSLNPLIDLRLPESKTLAITLEALGREDAAEMFRLQKRDDLARQESFLDEVIQVTRGEAFYLRHLVPDLAEQHGKPRIPADLPSESDAYIRRQVEGLNGAKLWKLARLEGAPVDPAAVDVAYWILRVLSLAHDWLTESDLLEILSHHSAVLIRSLLPALGHYIQAQRDVLRPDARRYVIRPLRLRDAVRSAYSQQELAEASQRLLAFCREWPRHRSIYALRHLAEHLESAGEYKELIRTLDRPFFFAKSKALHGVHSVLPDLRRALRMALSREDAIGAIRLTLLTAQTRQVVDTRAYNGGVALDAARGMYDAALSAARAIGSPAVQFRQLLLVAEFALKQRDYTTGLTVLDELLEVEIDPGTLPAKAADELLEMLVVRDRALPRALQLARKIFPPGRSWEEADWKIGNLLEHAAARFASSDEGYVGELAESMPDDGQRSHTLIRLALDLLPANPVRSRQILDSEIERAKGGDHYTRVLNAAEVLRQIDLSGASGLVEYVLEQTAQDPVNAPDRFKATVYNHAIWISAFGEPEKALRLALTNGVDLKDSESTRASLVANIVGLANLRKLLLDSADLESAERVRLEDWKPDPLWTALAVQHGIQGSAQRALNLLGRITDPTWRAVATLELHSLSMTPLEAVQATLAEAGPKPEEPLRASLRECYRSNPGAILSAIGALPKAAQRVFLLLSLLESVDSFDKRIGEACLRTLASLKPKERIAPALKLAALSADDEPALAIRLLKQQVGLIKTHKAAAVSRDHSPAAIALAVRLNQADLAVEVLGLQVRVLLDDEDVDEEDRKGALTLLAYEFPDQMVRLDRAIVEVILPKLDSLTSSRLIARWTLGDAYVSERVATVSIRSGRLLSIVLGFAQQYHDRAAMKRILGSVTSYVDRVQVLAAEAQSLAGSDPGAARECLREAWELLEPVAQRRLEADSSDGQDLIKCQSNLIIVLSEIDPREAASQAKILPDWGRHLALTSIASGRNDPDALECLREARAIARKQKSPVNRVNALGNVSVTADATFPEFARECRAQLIVALRKVPTPRSVEVALSWMNAASGDLQFQDSLWKRFSSGIRNADWFSSDRAIFKLVTDLRDASLKHKAWRLISRSIQAQTDFDGFHSAARAAWYMAASGDEKLAEDLLSHAGKIEPLFADYGDLRLTVRAWMVSAQGKLGHPAAPPELDRLLDDTAHDVRDSFGGLPPHYEVVEILASRYPGIAESPAWTRLERLLEIPNEWDDGADARRALVRAMMAAGKLQKAIGLLADIPLRSLEREDFDDVFDSLPSETQSPGSFEIWDALLNIAEKSDRALVQCAGHWAEDHLTKIEDSSEGSRILAAILDQLDFVSKEGLALTSAP